MRKIDVAGLKIDAITKKQLLEAVLARIKAGQKTFISTPYSEFLYHGFQDPQLLEIFNRADFAVADGIGIFWAKRYLDIPLTAKTYWGKILQALWQISYSLAAIIFNPVWIKQALPEKIVGADLVWDLAKLAEDEQLSIFLLGGFKNTPELAAKKVSVFLGREKHSLLDSPKKQIFWSNKNPADPGVIDYVNRANADILFVAYGPVKQEKWITNNLEKLNIKLAIGVGGTFDYIAGKKSAPPKFVRYSGLEWLWRLITQPYRAKRIFNATFGVANYLSRYKVFESLPYRKNVVAAIINNENKILICERNPGNPKDKLFGYDKKSLANYWQFPQGGVNEGEDSIKTAERECREEISLTKLEFLKVSQKTNTYKWPNALRPFFGQHSRFCGQTQNIVYFKHLGNDGEVKVDNIEFINYRWVNLNEVDNIVHRERLSLAKIIKDDLKDLA